MKKFMFFLGGKDAEMREIKNILIAGGLAFEDADLAWNNAKASVYAAAIKTALASGFTPVLVELVQDISLELLAQCLVVDHHNQYVDCPASLLQVLNLLGLEPTRKQMLLAANDSGYIPAMLALGASREEVEAIRALDWQAQGLTQKMIAEALAAYAQAEVINGVIVVKMPQFTIAPVTDAAFWDQPSQNLLLVVADGRTIYFGDGEKCSLIHEAFKQGGWRGGNFVGNADPELQDKMVAYVLKLNSNPA